MKKTYTIDVNDKLMIADAVLSEVLPLPEGVIFCTARRDPVTTKELDKLRMVRSNIANKPFYPYLAAYLLKELFYAYAVLQADNSTLFYSNPLLTDGQPKRFYNGVVSSKDYEEVIYEFLTIEQDTMSTLVIPQETIKTLLSLLLPTVKELYSYVGDNNNCILELNIASNFFILTIGMDIRAYRYTEATDKIETKEVLSDVVHANIEEHNKVKLWQNITPT